MTNRLATLRSKLDALAKRDHGLRAFGAAGSDGHGYRERPRLDAAAVANLERAYGFELPNELRTFLLHVHGGGPGPGYGLYLEPPEQTLRAARPFPYDARNVAAFTAPRTATRVPGLEQVEDPDDGEGWPLGPGFLGIAHHGCGSFDVIVTAGEQRGLIWFCDMLWYPRVSPRGSVGFLDWYEAWLDKSLASLDV